MARTPWADGRRPGRPRSERARQAILQAAGELLLTGAGGEVSMDALAAHAGVSKATIYRWWPDKEALALDALYEQWADRGDAPPDRGSLRGDLLALLRPWARLVRSRPYAPVIGAFITKAHNDPAFAESTSPGWSGRAATGPECCSTGPSTAASWTAAHRSRSPSTCCTGRCTTGCCTATPPSPTSSSPKSST